MAPFLSLPFPFSFRRESAQGNICLLHSSFATASAFDTAQGSHSVQLGVLGHSAISYSYFAIYYNRSQQQHSKMAGIKASLSSS